MSTITEKIESILFVTARPLSIRKLAELCGAQREEVSKALDAIAAVYNTEERGVRVMRHGDDVQMATAPGSSKLVQEFLKDETTGELTKPSLEALTIVAYRGPITKAELEQIRGVNCSLILRNLMMRGLVEAQGEVGQPLTTFRVTLDFVRFLGVSTIEELPEYDKLRSHENVVRILEMATAAPAPVSFAAVPDESAPDDTEEPAEVAAQ